MRSFASVAMTLVVLVQGAWADESSGEDGPSRQADVLVYGATPGGIAAAVAAGREGRSVLLVEPTGHLGGLASGGLSNTDFRSYESHGGLWREFTAGVERHYRETYGEDSQELRDCAAGGYYEPGVAKAVFEQMLAAANVQVLLRHRLTGVRFANDQVGTDKSPGTIQAIDVETWEPKPGATLVGPVTGTLRLAAKMFVDGTYEGDLMATAGVAYHLGVESKSTYNESLALNEEQPWVQTYNFRVTLARDPENRLPIPKPDNYDRDEYAPLVEMFAKGQLRGLDHTRTPKGPIRIRPMANNKADFNDVWESPISLSIENINHPWPEGDWETREEIYQHYKDFSLGLFWFFANDPELPEQVRDAMQIWGLPKDEFEDNDHWSPALYVREGRRMIGQYVFTQHDVFTHDGGRVRADAQPQAVALTEYGINCHGVYSPRFGVTYGHFHRHALPSGVPYGVMVPNSVTNLLVPVAVSSSHIGFCGLRYEPVWMGLGHAAGLAIDQALAAETAVQDVDVRRLQLRLHEQGAITAYFSDLAPERRIQTPTWESDRTHTIRLMEPGKLPPHFRAAQYWGTLGMFDDLIAAEDAESARRPKLIGQWNFAFANHQLEPNKPLDEALAARWLKFAGELGVEIPLSPRQIEEGRFTRGRLLDVLFVEACTKPSATD